MSSLFLQGALLFIGIVVDSTPISNQIGDRIVYTDISHQIVYPSDNGNNQSKNSYQRFCPEVTNGTTLAANLDSENVTCHEIGTQGPCSENMIFYAVPGKSDLGMCDCDQEMRGIAFHQQTEQCYQLYGPEPCADGEWFQLTLAGATCTFNPCIVKKATDNTTLTTESSSDTTAATENSNVNVTTVLLDGYCATLYEKCTMSDGSIGQVGFDVSNEISCLPYEANYSLTKSIPHLKCSAGTRWSTMTNSCRKAIKFTFS